MFNVGDVIVSNAGVVAEVLCVGKLSYFVRRIETEEDFMEQIIPLHKDSWRLRPKEHVRYVNLHDAGGCYGFSTKEGADCHASACSSKRIACKRIVITEGEFDA